MTDPNEPVKDESTVPDNLTAINAAKGRRGRPPKPIDPNAPIITAIPDPKRPSPAVLYEAIFGAITKSIANILPEFPANLALVEFDIGIPIPISIASNGQCTKLKQGQIPKLIMKYTRSLSEYEYRFKPAECRECAEYWEMASDTIKIPAHVRFLSDPGTCWNRLPFDRNTKPTPLFDEFFGLMTENADQIKAWIGSLFFPESYMQQFVWLQGKGNDGKSALLRFLRRVFGASALPQTKAPTGEHWGELYPGKRIVFFPDFKDFGSLNNGPLKQLTGGDPILINPKNHPAYIADLCAKYIFSSQQKPPLDMDYAIIRRLIFTEMRHTEKPFNSKWEDQLWNEGGSFLNSCIEMFHKLCPDPKQPIPVSDKSKEDLIAWGARVEDQYQLWFDEYLVEEPNSFVVANDLAQRIRNRFKDKLGEKEAYDFLDKKGFKRIRQKYSVDKKRPWIYPGLKLSTKEPSLH